MFQKRASSHTYSYLALLIANIGLFCISLYWLFHDTLDPLNIALYKYGESLWGTWVQDAMTAFTHFAEPVVVAFILIFIVSLLVARRAFKEVHLLIFSSALTVLVIYGTKMILDIPRPTTALLEETSGRFPSGHAAAIMMLALGVSLLFRKKEAYQQILAGMLLVFLIIGVGASRIFLHVHMIEDILTGFAVALTSWSLILLAGPRHVRRVMSDLK